MSAKSGEYQTPERELEDAILACNVTPSDFRVFVTLLKMADRGTAAFPAKWQPKSLVALAERCFISLAGVKRSLGHLESHGWIERYQFAGGHGGRSHPTHYKLLLGVACNCKAAHAEPVKGPKAAQSEPRNRLTTPAISAGQPAVPRGRARGREEREGKPKREYMGGPVDWETGEPLAKITATGWDPGSYGAAENREP